MIAIRKCLKCRREFEAYIGTSYTLCEICGQREPVEEDKETDYPMRRGKRKKRKEDELWDFLARDFEEGNQEETKTSVEDLELNADGEDNLLVISAGMKNTERVFGNGYPSAPTLHNLQKRGCASRPDPYKAQDTKTEEYTVSKKDDAFGKQEK